MSVIPLAIRAICTEETISIGDDVMVTVLSAQDNQACVSVVAPDGMEISLSAERKIFHANDGARMAAFRIGETLSIGLEISLLLLTVNDGKLRLGVSSPDRSLIRRYTDKRNLQNRIHAHGFF